MASAVKTTDYPVLINFESGMCQDREHLLGFQQYIQHAQSFITTIFMAAREKGIFGKCG